MPGYYIHLATITGKSAQNRSFVCGVETPDILKKPMKWLIAGRLMKYFLS